MATLVDCVRMAYEGAPRFEGAPLTDPFEVSAVVRDFPTQECQVAPGPQFLSRGDEARGIEGEVEQLVETFDPVGVLRTRCYLDDFTWLLGLAGFKGVFTAGDGIITDPDAATIPAGASRWVFTKRGGNTAKTAQITACYSDEGVFLRGHGYGISQLQLPANGDVSADLTGLFFENLAADPNISPVFADPAIPHVRPGDLTITGLTGAPVDIDAGFVIAVTNPLEKRRSGTVVSLFPDKLEHAAQRVQVRYTIPKSSFADADIDALLAGTSFNAKTRWQVNKVIGGTGKKYTLWCETPKLQMTAGTIAAITNARRFPSSFEFMAAWDIAAGFDAKWTIVNAVTSIADAVVGN